MGNCFYLGNKAIEYEIGKHPGAELLPPIDIMYYPSLPESVRSQIYDGSMYDLYGKLGYAFDDSYISAPTG